MILMEEEARMDDTDAQEAREALGQIDRKLRRQQVELRATLRHHGERLDPHLKGDLYALLDTLGTARDRVRRLTKGESR